MTYAGNYSSRATIFDNGDTVEGDHVRSLYDELGSDPSGSAYGTVSERLAAVTAGGAIGGSFAIQTSRFSPSAGSLYSEQFELDGAPSVALTPWSFQNTYLANDAPTEQTLRCFGLKAETYYGTATTYPAKGTIHNLTSNLVVRNCSGATSEHANLAGALRYDVGTGYTGSGTTPGRAWFADFALHGAVAQQQNLLSGVTMFVNNHFNGQPSSGDSVGVTVCTLPGAGTATDATHAAAATFPVGIGLHVTGLASSSARGFNVGLKVGGASAPWAITTNRVGTGLSVENHDAHAIDIGARYSGSSAVAIRFNDAAGDVQFGTATGTRIGTAANQRLGFWGATPDVRPSGWTAATGTATRTTFATGSVTLPQLAERVKALIDDFISRGLIGA